MPAEKYVLLYSGDGKVTLNSDASKIALVLDHIATAAATCVVPAGNYVLLYSGDGKVTLDSDATVTAEAPGRLELTIKPAAGASCGWQQFTARGR
jgi:hypothetical protein